VMPVATPLLKQLGTDPQADAVVTAIRDVARTLAALADRGIGHRDLKPDNLFYLDGEWCVGDFGLVKYPEKDPVTRAGRRLGPIDYMAPEMRADADTADPQPADVYSLAKTLWVLLTRQSLPLPGTHRLDDAAYALGTYLRHRRLTELDVLMEASTRHEPTDRPSMREFADQLDAWLRAPAEAADVPDVANLAARIELLTLPAMRTMKRESDRQHGAGQALQDLKSEGLEPVCRSLEGIGGITVGATAKSGAFRAAWGYDRDPAAEHQDGFACVAQTVGAPVYLVAAVGVELLGADAMRLSACFVLEDLGQETVRRVLWADRREVRLNSSGQQHAIRELTSGLIGNTPLALGALATHLADG
jgi:protein tyrosine kinase